MKRHFTIELNTSTYQFIKKGKCCFVPVNFSGIANIENVVDVEIDNEKSVNGRLCVSVNFHLNVIKIVEKDTKRYMFFRIIDIRVTEEVECLTGYLFLGEQLYKDYPYSDVCDVDMVSVSKAYITKYFNNSMELLTKIDEAWDAFKVNADKKEKGNKAAGVRARKASLELAKLLKEYRAESVKA